MATFPSLCPPFYEKLPIVKPNMAQIAVNSVNENPLMTSNLLISTDDFRPDRNAGSLDINLL